jgi:hypothetical protein
MTAIASLRQTARWRPDFVRASPWLEVLATPAALLADCDDWPTVQALDARLQALAGVRFLRQPPRPRFGPAPRVYDARIVTEQVVLTRARSWHDLLNALVWARFPRAKAQLHARQHRVLTTHLRSRGDARGREGDALAMLDEGGVLLTDTGPLLFGHGIAEGLVLGSPRLVARTLTVPGDDLALAALLADPQRLRHPDELGRLTVRSDDHLADSRCNLPMRMRR